MSIKRIAAITGFIVLPVAVIFLGIASNMIMAAMKPPPKENDSGPTSLAVFASEAIISDVSLSIDAQGAVRPKRQVELSPQVAGRVTYVSPNLENGGMVRRGELLVKIEDADYKLAAVRAESAVATGQQALETAEAEAAIAREELKELGIENPSPLALREPQLAEARASLAAAQAQAEDAALQLARTEVRAPFDALVASKNVETGKYVSPGSPVGTIFAKDVVEVELAIPNEDLGNLGLPIAFNASKSTPGPEVIMTANVGGQPKKWVGSVTRTGASIDSTTRLVSVFAEVKDPFGEGSDDGTPLAPGLFVNATIQGRIMDGVIRTPRAALRGLDTMYVVQEREETAEDTRQRIAGEKAEKLGEVEQVTKRAQNVLNYTIPADVVKKVSDEIEETFKEKTEKELEKRGPDTVKVQFLEIRSVRVLRSTENYVYVTAGLEPGEEVIISPVQGAMTGMRVRTIDSIPTNNETDDARLALATDDSATGAN